jgi:histidinol phosphatase-like enzyme
MTSPKPQNRAAFLDLNGTVVLPLKQESLASMTLIPGADLAISRLLAAGFLCSVVTVQSRIEKGLFTESEFRACQGVTTRMLTCPKAVHTRKT